MESQCLNVLKIDINFSLVHPGAQNCCLLKYLTQRCTEIHPGTSKHLFDNFFNTDTKCHNASQSKSRQYDIYLIDIIYITLSFFI